jgi:hypothetical protein
VTTETPAPRFEDRLLEALEQHLAESPAPSRVSTGRPARRGPLRRRRRLALVGVPATFAAVALIVIPSLGGSSPAIAQAAVLRHAAAALDQPNTITYLSVQDYSATGMGPCYLGLGAPLPCIGTGSGAATATGISADPADDALTYGSQEWTGPDGQTRTLYNNGDELVSNADDDGYAAFARRRSRESPCTSCNSLCNSPHPPIRRPGTSAGRRCAPRLRRKSSSTSTRRPTCRCAA